MTVHYVPDGTLMGSFLIVALCGGTVLSSQFLGEWSLEGGDKQEDWWTSIWPGSVSCEKCIANEKFGMVLLRNLK